MSILSSEISCPFQDQPAQVETTSLLAQVTPLFAQKGYQTTHLRQGATVMATQSTLAERMYGRGGRAGRDARLCARET